MITCPKAPKSSLNKIRRLGSLDGYHREYGIEQEEKEKKTGKETKKRTPISEFQEEILQCLLVRFPQPPKPDRRLAVYMARTTIVRRVSSSYVHSTQY